jgi:hypothetical protein
MDMSLEQAANYGLMLGSCSTAFAASFMSVAPAAPPIRSLEIHNLHLVSSHAVDMPSKRFLFSRWRCLESKKRLKCALLACFSLYSSNTDLQVLNLIGRNISAVKSQSDNFIKVCLL